MTDILSQLSLAEQQVETTETLLARIADEQPSFAEEVASRSRSLFQRHSKTKEKLVALRVALVKAVIPVAQAIQQCTPSKVFYTLDANTPDNNVCGRMIYTIDASQGTVFNYFRGSGHQDYGIINPEYLGQLASKFTKMLIDQIMQKAHELMQEQSTAAMELKEAIDQWCTTIKDLAE